jgi:hypothetical protein
MDSMVKFEGVWLKESEVRAILKQRRKVLELLESEFGIKNKCECEGWGCRKCCHSEQEIRSRQGIYG